MWWIDRYADLQFATGNPEEKADSVLKAFDKVTGALRHDAALTGPLEMSVLRARAGELLSALEDPATRKRTGDLLETLVGTPVPGGRSEEGDRTG